MFLYGNHLVLLMWQHNCESALCFLFWMATTSIKALPVMVETISRKVLEHIDEQCLRCCDMGIPCNTRQACDDPSSLIFPFQEGEIERYKSCESVFHKHCFTRISICPCGSQLKPEQECNTRNQSDNSLRDLSLDLP